ncbi:MAG TPA: DUF2075 domain-containing protein, partial [Bacteroidia bacterium]|nr:DUF2075 domain-containing protein [Bacteroidia bacterium]
VAPNASFRDVMISKLVKGGEKKRAEHLFKGSGSFYNRKENEIDVIIVDEAHRLKNANAYMYVGENQVDDIIKSSFINVFFIDELQMIRPDDIGSIKEIKQIADKYNSDIIELELTAQFRCAGAEGFINWISDVLEIENTGNYDGWDKNSFDFRIFSDPNEMKKSIAEKNSALMSARMLAGYAWKWTAEKDGNYDAEVRDISIPEHKFEMPWNSRKITTTWAIDPSGINQIGCVHTSQGLEFDYVGVIVGKDLQLDDQGNYFTDWNEYKDSSGKRGLKNNLVELNRFVRNIYRILLTRGMKGCYVYFVDKKLEAYFRKRFEMAK